MKKLRQKIKSFQLISIIFITFIISCVSNENNQSLKVKPKITQNVSAQPKPQEKSYIASLIIKEEQEDADAQYNLGVMYDKGLGVTKSDIKAYAWISLAAANGYAPASESIGKLEKLMTAKQITAAKKYNPLK